jgi:hypothetical protein
MHGLQHAQPRVRWRKTLSCEADIDLNKISLAPKDLGSPIDVRIDPFLGVTQVLVVILRLWMKSAVINY